MAITVHNRSRRGPGPRTVALTHARRPAGDNGRRTGVAATTSVPRLASGTVAAGLPEEALTLARVVLRAVHIARLAAAGPVVRRTH